jgi:hypothetical protein
MMAVRAQQRSSSPKSGTLNPQFQSQGRLGVFVFVPASQSCGQPPQSRLSSNAGQLESLQQFHGLSF